MERIINLADIQNENLSPVLVSIALPTVKREYYQETTVTNEPFGFTMGSIWI